MKKAKRGLLLLVILLLIPSVLAGCKPRMEADEAAKTYFDYDIKGDKVALSKMGGTEKDYEEGTKKLENEFVSKIKNKVTSAGWSITDKQAQSIFDAYMNSLKKVKETASIVSEDSKTAQVKIKTTYIDSQGIDSKSEQDALSQVKSAGIKNPTELETKFMEIYVKNLVDGLNNAKPSIDTNEKVFKFVIKNRKWVPESFQDYYEQIWNLTQKN